MGDVPSPTIDPLTALARCEDIARDALDDIRGGRALNGSSALAKIKAEAGDARRWAPSASRETLGAR